MIDENDIVESIPEFEEKFSVSFNLVEKHMGVELIMEIKPEGGSSPHYSSVHSDNSRGVDREIFGSPNRYHREVPLSHEAMSDCPSSDFDFVVDSVTRNFYQMLYRFAEDQIEKNMDNTS